MTGYTRQSIADIINGADITAPPLNAEFNKLSDAFSGTDGHTHDGTAGNAPPIDLTTSVEGFLPAANGGSGGRNNLSATSNPTSLDDNLLGYAVGSLWENVTTGRMFICVGNFTSAAVWRELAQVDFSVDAIFPEVTNTVDLGTPTNRYQDLWLNGGISAQGNVAIAGTLNTDGTSNLAGVNATSATVTGLSTLAQIDANSGTIDGTIIGASAPSAITGTTIQANSGFLGNVTGNVTGDVSSSGTSTFNNISASGTTTGTFVGNITGNVTSAGTSTFNNVTISGTLNMNSGTTATITNLSSPVNGTDAATKLYVDTSIANLIDGAPGTLDTLNELAAAIGDNANYAATITTALAGKVSDTGDTMTGNLSMANGATVTGIPTPVNVSDAVSKAYADQQDALKLDKVGGTMTGPIAMSGNKITNLATPTAPADAARKDYVDAILGSATAASASAAAAATSEASAAQSEALAGQYANSTQVVTVAANIDAVTAVANLEAEVTAVGTNIENVNAVATNLVGVNSFAERYIVSDTAPFGPNVLYGDLWFDTTNQVLKVFSGNGWIEAGSSVNGIAERKDYIVGTASGEYDGSSATVFPATYTPGYVDVYLNGIKLSLADFTATDRVSVTLVEPAANADEISIISYGAFELADTYTQAQIDTELNILKQRIVALEDETLLNLGVL